MNGLLALVALLTFAAGWLAATLHWRRKVAELQERLEACQAKLSAEIDFLQIYRRNEGA